jgi:hypothetical protein
VLPEPDIILPSQFLPRTIATPEKRLLLAVLEEAIGTFQRYATATDRNSRALFADVEAWFASEDTAWLYSFIGICDAVGIDATYVRSGLGRWLGTHRTPSLATAQPLYRFPFRRVNGTRCRTTGRAEGMSRRA